MEKRTTTSWQERYHASGIYTLRCRVRDEPGTLGRLIASIGETHTHVGTIETVGMEPDNKLRDIQVYCSDEKHLGQLLDHIKSLDGIGLVAVHDDVLEIHRRGTIVTRSRVPINSLNTLRMLYTPGVASVCGKISSDPETAWEMTGLCDRVAIVTNGTAVLGLGDIGPVPSLPVMEGKAAIFSEFAGISAFPILVDSTDVDAVVTTVKHIAPGFGAIQLEDIAAPACFEIEEKLRAELPVPVFHDDQHGTATVVLAALINTLKQTGRKPEESSALVLGAGAAGFAIALILREFGLEDIIVFDATGPLFEGRTERMNPYKKKLAEWTNRDNFRGSLRDGFKGRDIFVGVARPNLVTREMVQAMAPDPVVFPLSNPVGEINVEDAKAAGAAIAADGRAVNNALAYPGLFRGALDARAKEITLHMQLAAANKLAELAPRDALLPDMLNRKVHREVARAVADAYLNR